MTTTNDGMMEDEYVRARSLNVQSLRVFLSYITHYGILTQYIKANKEREERWSEEHSQEEEEK